MPRGPSRPYPQIPIMEAIKVPQGIREHNGGRPMNRVLLAEALKLSPTSSDFRDLLSASYKYGFTKGSFNSESIELTELGEQLTKPRSEMEKLDAMRKGLRRIALFEKLLTHFNNNKLPAAEFLKNTLEREPFSVTPEWSAEAVNVFVANGKAVGFIRDVSGSPFVVIEAGPPAAEVSEAITEVEKEHVAILETTEEKKPALPTEQKPKTPTEASPVPTSLQFFIGHGKDKGALEQLKGILNELGIPYVVAQEEPNVGRPISKKIKDLMDSCSGGIFIFSADEEFRDLTGNSIFRPRENVVFEIGAASYKYDQRIVIFKENGVAFPSDFRDLGYIEYDKGQLAGKTMELLKELIALKAVKILPGS
jgi:predicted nucleotide-binding protein